MVPGQVIKADTIEFMRKLDVKEIHGYANWAADQLRCWKLKPSAWPAREGLRPAPITNTHMRHGKRSTS